MTGDHGTLSSDIRPATVSVVWLAQRTDLPLTAEAALARARTWLTRQGAWCEDFEPGALSFGVLSRRRGAWWLTPLIGCRVRAERAGERASVTVEGSVVLLILWGVAWIGILVFHDLPPVISWLAAGYSVVHGWYASSRLKYLAQYATCMVPDEPEDDANGVG